MKNAKAILTYILAILLGIAIVGCAQAQADDAGRELENFGEQFIEGNGDHDQPSYGDDTSAGGFALYSNSAFAAAEAYLADHAGSFTNQNYIAVVDYGLHSSRPRFFLKNRRTGSIQAFVVAHGSGSDRDNDGYAERFSNTSGSNASSIGFARASETYYGKNGLSLRLDGLSSTNSNMRRRAVVIHGSDYVALGKSKQGRSYGCPALDRPDATKAIHALKGGALVYLKR